MTTPILERETLAGTYALTFVSFLLLLGVVGGVFAIAADAIVQRFGHARLVVLWIATSIGLGALGTLRSLAVQRSIGVDMTRIHQPGFYLLFIVTALIILAVPTFVIARRTLRVTLPESRSRQFVAGFFWALCGLFVVMVVGLILDLAGVSFIPIR